MPSCLTLNIIRYVSRVKQSNPGKEVTASPTSRCSSYRKGSLRVAFDSDHQLTFTFPTNYTATCLPPRKLSKLRQTRLARHCWGSRNELISDVLLWTPTYGRTKAGRPARTYIQQLCEDTGCSPEDLPEAMNDREKWRERVRDIRASGSTWWWWWLIRNWT